jgi:hypothetical protein
VAALDHNRWIAASDALRRFVRNVPGHRQLNVGDALRLRQMTPSSRLAILMWQVGSRSTRTRLCQFIADDLANLWNCGVSVQAALQEFVKIYEQPFDAAQLRGARHDLPPTHLRANNVKSMTQSLAEQILAEPHNWPTAVVRRATDRLATRLEKQSPVSMVATRHDWRV